MATKLKVNYELVGDSTTPVTRTESIKHGDRILSSVVSGFATELAEKTKVYDTVSAMKTDSTLTENTKCRTLGYNSVNDGGGAYYVIGNSNSGYTEVLDNGKYAKLIVENNTIDIRQFGAFPDLAYDIKPYIEKYANGLEDKKITLYMPSGVWHISPTHLYGKSISIHGDGRFSARGSNATIIRAMNDQDYVLKLGGFSDMGDSEIPQDRLTNGCEIIGITFSSEHVVRYGCLVLEYCNYSTFDRVAFQGIVGCGLLIRSCWENRYNNIVVRAKQDFRYPAILCANARAVKDVSPNISSSIFGNFIVESCSGHVFEVEKYAGFVNNLISNFTAEWTFEISPTDTVVSSANDVTDIHVFKGNMKNTVIDNIVITGSNTKMYKNSNNTVFRQGSIINILSNEEYKESDIATLSIGNIAVRTPHTVVSAKNTYNGMINISQINLEHVSQEENTIFDFENVFNNVDVGTILSRKQPVNYLGIPLYRYLDGTRTVSDVNSENKLHLVGKHGTGTWGVKGIRYPFNNDVQHTIHVRIHANEGDQFTLRTVLNGVNQNSIYHITETGYTVASIKVNADLGSEVSTLYGSENLLYDSLWFE